VSLKRRALGRGLAALIPGAAASAGVTPSASGDSLAADGGASAGTVPFALPSAQSREGLRTVGIEEVHPSREQPRKEFGDARLDELAESIRSQGLIQPLIVRARTGGGYELIAGERRWRAAQRAGLHEVPVVVRDVAPGKAFELAMVENLQRQDLNPLEEAEGYQRLIAEYGYTQESLAGRVGKDRTTIANALRLLKLPESVRDLLASGRLAMGHARALLGLETAEAIERLARQIASRDLSVRKVEDLVRRERAGADRAPAENRPAAARPTASARDLEVRLSHALGARVRVVETSQTAGHVEIHYGSLDQLDGVLAKLMP
jgi:ParB family chromosome partitioning protein